jgi:WD40 repeat protein
VFSILKEANSFLIIVYPKKISFLIFVLLLLVSYGQNDDFICKEKIIWDIRKSPYKGARQRIRKLLKRMAKESFEEAQKSYLKVRKIIPYELPYLKKIYKRFNSAILREYFKGYFLAKLLNITKLEIVCKVGKNFIWYAVIDNIILVIGSNKGIIDSFPILLEKWRIGKTACNITNNDIAHYAVEIERLPTRNSTYYRFVFSDGRIYSDASLVEGPPNSKVVAVKTTKFGKVAIIVDGIKIDEYDKVVWQYFKFSPDGKRYAYVAQKQDDQFLILDGKVIDVQSKQGGIYTRVLFTPDSRKFIYTVSQYNALFDKSVEKVIVDGKEEESFDYIKSIEFSPDGRRIAYVGVREGKEFVVVDSHRSRGYDYIVQYSFSPDSKKFGYIAVDTVNQVVVVNDKEIDIGERVKNLVFYEGSKFAYVIMKNSKWKVVIDGKESAPYEEVEDLSYDRNLKKIVYRARVGDTQFFMIEQQQDIKHKGIVYLKVSPQGNRKAYIVRGIGGWQVVIDGESSILYDGFPYFIFSPDGKRYAYFVFHLNQYIVIIDGKEVGRYEYVKDIMFSDDGSHYFYIIRRDKNYFVIVDGKESKEYQSVDFQSIDGSKKYILFSNDGKHYAYIAKVANVLPRYIIVTDKGESDEFNEVIEFGFTKDTNKLFVVAKKDAQQTVVMGKPVDYFTIVAYLAKQDNSIKFIGFKFRKLFSVICK